MDSETPGVGETSSWDFHFDEEIVICIATQWPQTNIIPDIIGHPQGAPSVQEIAYMNPDLNTNIIRRSLRILRESDIVCERVLKPDDRIDGYPDTFYTLSNDARELFDQYGIYPTTSWKRQYSSVRKSMEISTIESIPRPID